MPVFYDDALPQFATIVADVLGAEALLKNCFLRDASGLLTFVVTSRLDQVQVEEIAKRAIDLAPYVSETNSIATPEELFDPTLSDPGIGFPEWIDSDGFTGFIRLIERRVVGQDWLVYPREPNLELAPITVFASHKGGVGRSTALAVAAAALSETGLNVLVIDLDLEAPGLGEILLRDPPEYGTLDFFVEDIHTELNDHFYENMVISSPLTKRGLLHVAPAVGRVGNNCPQNILGKIARAYLDKTGSDGSAETFLERARRLVDTLARRHPYDAIFVDARAGLNEATAAAVLGLGAQVLLFGVDTPQTFAGYRYFLSHLQRFRPSESDENDWRYRLRMVQAKAQADSKAQSEFRTRAFEIFSDTIYDEEVGIEEEAFNFDYDDQAAPHYAWPILNDSNYSEFNPFAREDQFAAHLYDRTFGGFIAALRDSLGFDT
jgi:hypothetical protein